MSRLVSDEAFCLRRRPWRETSKLVTVFTRRHGRLVVVAKGARRPGSKFGAALEVLTHCRVSYYWSEDRAFHTLADADIVAMFPNLRQRESDLGAGLVIAEFCDRCFETGASHPDVFALARDALRVLDSAPGAGEPVALSFLLRAGGLLGYAPELGRCIGCRASRAATFSARRGGLLCRRCSALDPDAQPLDAPTLHRLQALKQGTLEQNRQQAVSAAAAGMVLRYLQYHFDRFQLRSLRHQAQSERTGA